MRGFNREFAFRTDSTDGLADDVARSLQRHVDEHDRAANTHPRCVSCFVGDVSVSTVVPLIARVPSGGLQLGRISVVATSVVSQSASDYWEFVFSYQRFADGVSRRYDIGSWSTVAWGLAPLVAHVETYDVALGEGDVLYVTIQPTGTPAENLEGLTIQVDEMWGFE